MPLEAPSVDLRLERMQSANQSVPFMLVQRHYSEFLTMPLKDATSRVDYLK